MTNVLVTGGAGYKGCVLVPKLLEAGYHVTVYDLMLFGSQGLPSHPNLRVVKGDIRDTESYADAVKGCYAVIHMACISNDPSFELDPELSKAINYDCFEPLVRASKQAGVGRFLYVSSSSVYGVSDARDVTEEHPLNLDNVVLVVAVSGSPQGRLSPRYWTRYPARPFPPRSGPHTVWPRTQSSQLRSERL